MNALFIDLLCNLRSSKNDRCPKQEYLGISRCVATLFRETIASFLEMPAPFSAQLIWQVCGKMHRHPACPGFGVGIHVYVQSPASNIDVWSL